MAMMCGDEHANAIVIDVGSCTTKVGFAGEECPQHIFNSAVGTWQDESDMDKSVAVNRREIWHARYQAGLPLEIENPVVQGRVTDWELLDKVWQYSFHNQLGVDTELHPVLVVDQPFSSQADQEQLAQMLFENHSVPSMYIGKSAALSCTAAGKSTGIVVDSGAGISSAVAVLDGLVVAKSVTPSALCGDSLSDFLYDILSKGGNTLNPAHQFHKNLHSGAAEPLDTSQGTEMFAGYRQCMNRVLVREIKEGLCQLPEAFIASTTQVPGLTAMLPDGNTIELQKARFDVPELMITGHEKSGAVDEPTLEVLRRGLPAQHHCATFETLPTILNEAIMKCDEQHRKDIYSNLIVCGGNSLFPRTSDRLASVVVNQFEPTARKVISGLTLVQRKWSGWVGGSIMASFPSASSMMIQKEEYQEHGYSIVARKCP